jgi:protein-tyrosine kinase
MRYQKALKKAREIKQTTGGIYGKALSAEYPPPVYNQSKHCKLNMNLVNKHICLGLKANTPEMDAYRILRTRILQRAYTKIWKTVMITSILPSEGKTVTSINIALTVARTQNHTALLVDSDLRRQQVHRYLGLKHKKGLTDYLKNRSPITDLIVWPNVDKFTFISGGKSTDESSELLGSVRMQRLVEELKRRYPNRYVFFDSAPLLAGDDALTLTAWVDGIVMVVESHKTPMKLIQEALKLIPKEKFLGFVLNKHKTINKKYSKYYDRYNGNDSS